MKKIVKKIVMIGPAWPIRGGISLFNVLMKEALEANGNKVYLINFLRQYPDLIFPGNSQITPEKKPQIGECIIDTCNFYSWKKCIKKIKEFNPHVVIITWWHIWFFPSYFYIMHCVQKLGFKVIILCHNYGPRMDWKKAQFPSDIFFSKADNIIFLSQYVHNILPFNIKKGLKLFHPFIEWRKWPLVNLEHWSKKILWAGYGKSYKGIDIGLDLLKYDKTITLTISGDFYEKHLIKYLEESKNRWKDRLNIILGYISDEKLKDLIDSHDLLICPYKSATQSGIAAFALGRRRAVVATPVGGLPEQIYCKTGVISSNIDSKSLWEAILKIYDHTPKYWASQIQSVQKEWSWESFVEKMQPLLY